MTPLGGAPAWLRVIAWFGALAVVSAWAEIVGNVWCIWMTRRGSRARVERSNRLVTWWGSTLTDLVFRLLGAKLVVDGTVPPGRYIVVSNHQSTADIAILISVLRPLNCKFVAKRQLGRGLPAVSVALGRAGGALIARHPSRRDIARLRVMARGLEHWDGSAILFAEGKRSRDGSVLPYRTGAIRIVAEEAPLPLLPVAVDGTHVAADLPGFIKRMPGARGRICIGEPVPVARWSGRLDEEVARIREWAIAEIADGRRRGLAPTPASATQAGHPSDDLARTPA